MLRSALLWISFVVAGLLIGLSVFALRPKAYISQVTLDAGPYPAARAALDRTRATFLARTPAHELILNEHLYPAERQRLPLDDVREILIRNLRTQVLSATGTEVTVRLTFHYPDAEPSVRVLDRFARAVVDQLPDATTIVESPRIDSPGVAVAIVRLRDPAFQNASAPATLRQTAIARQTWLTLVGRLEPPPDSQQADRRIVQLRERLSMAEGEWPGEVVIAFAADTPDTARRWVTHLASVVSEQVQGAVLTAAPSVPESPAGPSLPVSAAAGVLGGLLVGGIHRRRIRVRQTPLRPYLLLLLLAGGVMLAPPVPALAQGKPAPSPLYRDPLFDAPTDPVLCFNAEQDKWLMYYTARRATAPDTPGVSWVHGTSIGIAESADGGATWTHRGTANINYGKDKHPNATTYWAPEVIWHDGYYHMFLSYVPGIFRDWNHPRQIVHLTSRDGLNWDSLGPVDLKSDRVIDAAVIRLDTGIWRMWYKDERKPKSLSYADSPDLIHWQPRGNAVTDRNGEGPKVIRWKGSYWLIADTWATGMRVWSSKDAQHWRAQTETLTGSHGDVVISGGRAWWFYFQGPSGQPKARTAAIYVYELDVVNGALVIKAPGAPVLIDLKPERESEN